LYAAAEARLEQQSEVDVSVVDGALAVECPEATRSLEDLLSQVTEENRHGDFDFGPPVGCEVW
jgi:antitoxin MazE